VAGHTLQTLGPNLYPTLGNKEDLEDRKVMMKSAIVIYLVAAQIMKYDKHSYSEVTEWGHVPILVQILPLRRNAN
jgi:hypothetical protein